MTELIEKNKGLVLILLILTTMGGAILLIICSYSFGSSNGFKEGYTQGFFCYGQEQLAKQGKVPPVIDYCNDFVKAYYSKGGDATLIKVLNDDSFDSLVQKVN